MGCRVGGEERRRVEKGILADCPSRQVKMKAWNQLVLGTSGRTKALLGTGNVPLQPTESGQAVLVVFAYFSF